MRERGRGRERERQRERYEVDKGDLGKILTHVTSSVTYFCYAYNLFTCPSPIIEIMSRNYTISNIIAEWKGYFNIIGTEHNARLLVFTKPRIYTYPIRVSSL